MGEVVGNADVCTDCPQGKLNDELGQGLCVDCLPGWNQDMEGQTECRECGAGKWSNPGDKECNLLDQRDKGFDAGVLAVIIAVCITVIVLVVAGFWFVGPRRKLAAMSVPPISMNGVLTNSPSILDDGRGRGQVLSVHSPGHIVDANPWSAARGQLPMIPVSGSAIMLQPLDENGITPEDKIDQTVCAVHLEP
jgi:hypothetical protein